MATVHFREAGRKLQVVAYRGYDKESKKPIVQMIGAIAYNTKEFTPAKEVKEIAPEERAQIDAQIKLLKEFDDRAVKESTIANLHIQLKVSAEGVNTYGTEAVSAEQAREIYIQMTALQKALKKAGYTMKDLLQEPTKKQVKEAEIVVKPTENAITEKEEF